MIKSWVATVVILIALGLNSASADSISVTDDFNRRVTLFGPAERIVSLAPHNTENLFSAGAGDKVVGAVNYSDYPEQANDIPQVGTHVQFNLEAIIALEPDLIVAWRSGKNADALTQLEEFGIPVYYSEPRTFEDIVDNILELAILAGTAAAIDSRLPTILSDIERLRGRYERVDQLDVFYQVWSDPLMTLNGKHFVSRVLEVCGATNLFSALPILAPRVSMEAVIEANPDVIVTGMVDDVPPDMTMWSKWHTVKAVANDHFVFVDSDVMHRHTLRMLNGIEKVCTELQAVRDSR